MLAVRGTFGQITCNTKQSTVLAGPD